MISTLVPASLIQDQEQVFVWHHPQVPGRKQPTGLSALWRNIPIEIHPLIARSDHSPYPGSFSRPDAAQDRFETDAVLILAPEFNAGFWIRLMQLLKLFWEFF